MGVYVCIYIVFPYCPRPFAPNLLNSWLSFGFRGFLMPTAGSSLSSRTPNLWYADALPSALALPWLCFGPCDPLLCDHSPIPCRDSGFRDSRCHEPLSSQSPDYRSTDAVLCVLAHRAKLLAHVAIIPQGHSLVPYRGFRHRNIKMHEPRIYGIPNVPIPDTPLPCVLALSAIPRSMWPAPMWSLPYGFPSGFRTFLSKNFNTSKIYEFFN